MKSNLDKASMYPLGHQMAVENLHSLCKRWLLQPTNGILFFLCGVIASIIILNNITYLTADWPIKSAHQMRTHYIVSPVSIVILTTLIFITLRLFFTKFLDLSKFLSHSNYKACAVATVLFFLWFGLVISSVAPGWFSEDVLYTYHMSRSGWWSGWYSPIHPFLYTVLLQIVPSMWFVTLVNAFFVSFALAKCLTLLRKFGVSKSVIIISGILLAILPPVLVMSLMPIRDSFFASIFIIAIVYTIEVLTNFNHKTKVVCLAFLWVFLAAYRTDALPVSIIIIAIFSVLQYKKLEKSRKIFGLIFLYILFYIFLTSGLKSIPGSSWEDRAEREYKLTLVSHPLTFMMRDKFYSSTPEEDKQVIERVFKYEDLKKHWNPYNIAVFYADAWNKDSTMEEREAMVERSNKIFLDNLGIYLTSKFMLFMRATGLQENEHFFYHKHNILPEKRVPVPNVGESLSWFGGKLTAYIEASQEYKGLSLSGRFLYWNLVIPNIIILVSLFLWSMAKNTAFFAGIILIRELVVVLWAPSTFVHYHFPVFIAGVVIFILLIAELNIRFRRRASSEYSTVT